MPSVSELKKQQKEIQSQIKDLESKKTALDNFSAAEFKELRDLYDQICEGVEEKKTINIEVEVTIAHFLNSNCDIASGEADTINEYKATKKNGNKFSAQFLVDHLEEMDRLLFEASASQKKAYKNKLNEVRKRFTEIAKAKGISVEELYDIVPSNNNLKEARKSIGE